MHQDSWEVENIGYKAPDSTEVHSNHATLISIFTRLFDWNTIMN